ncbi:hypothetical protein NIES2098_65630 [Calothrix sp. NIES-2098]|nr:hypothetical protein NIES2098_65630 [Calothrix sp. NIES-2098]
MGHGVLGIGKKVMVSLLRGASHVRRFPPLSELAIKNQESSISSPPAPCSPASLPPASSHSPISSYNETSRILASAKGFKFYSYSKSVNRGSLWSVLSICLISWVRSFLTTRVTLRSRTITTSSKPMVTITSSGSVA